MGDVESIVELVKLCLGDKPTRTKEFWSWKHLKSPFGSSYTMLAFDRDKLIGLRTFMKWQWIKNGVVYKCVRAVDTATHPGYQRQGIFSKLTYSLLEKMKEEMVDFIFNTPNEKSMPGYLKMRWELLGITRLHFKSTSISRLINNRFSSFEANNIKKEHDFNVTNKFAEIILNYIKLEHNSFKKYLSIEYLKWRYYDIPYYKYGLITDSSGKYSLIFRTNNRGSIRELRICDIFIIDINNNIINQLKKDIKGLLKQYKCDVATVTCEESDPLFSVLKKSGFINVGEKGLNVVLRSLNSEVDSFLDKNQWCYSTGDIEIF